MEETKLRKVLNGWAVPYNGFTIFVGEYSLIEPHYGISANFADSWISSVLEQCSTSVTMLLLLPEE